MFEAHTQDIDLGDFILVTPEDAIPHLSNTKLNQLKTMYNTETYNAYVLLRGHDAVLRTETAVAKAIRVVLATLDANTESMKQLEDELVVQEEIKAVIQPEIIESGKKMEELMLKLETKDEELRKAKTKAKKGR